MPGALGLARRTATTGCAAAAARPVYARWTTLARRLRGSDAAPGGCRLRGRRGAGARTDAEPPLPGTRRPRPV